MSLYIYIKTFYICLQNYFCLNKVLYFIFQPSILNVAYSASIQNVHLNGSLFSNLDRMLLSPFINFECVIFSSPYGRDRVNQAFAGNIFQCSLNLPEPSRLFSFLQQLTGDFQIILAADL